MSEVGRSGDVVRVSSQLGGAARRRTNWRTSGVSKVCNPNASTAQLPTDSAWSVCTPRDEREGGNRGLTLSDLRDLLPLLRKEEGQTIAEDGVVLAGVT